MKKMRQFDDKLRTKMRIYDNLSNIPMNKMNYLDPQQLRPRNDKLDPNMMTLMLEFQERLPIQINQAQQNTPHQQLKQEIQIAQKQPNMQILDMVQSQSQFFNIPPVLECNQCGLLRLGLDFHNLFHQLSPCSEPQQCFSLKNFGQVQFWSGLYSEDKQKNDMNFWIEQQNNNSIIAFIIKKMQMQEMDTKISQNKITSLIKNHQMCLDCSFCKCQSQIQIKCPKSHNLSYMSFYEELIERIQCDVCKKAAMQIKVGSYRCKACDFDMCMNCAFKQK